MCLQTTGNPQRPRLKWRPRGDIQRDRQQIFVVDLCTTPTAAGFGIEAGRYDDIVEHGTWKERGATRKKPPPQQQLQQVASGSTNRSPPTRAASAFSIGLHACIYAFQQRRVGVKDTHAYLCATRRTAI